MANQPERYQHAPEDWDIVCEVCGTKWDFVDDKAVCPCCGDTLNKVEIATLKEEAYIRRRKKQLAQEEKEKEEKEKAMMEAKKKKRTICLSVIAIIAIAGICFFVFCPEQAKPITNFFKNLFS